ncbi:MAG: hypothetical protein SFZ23_05250 [Planctomycetota bacterium]|nr:hypothetical protein [Planctomycetota bacterium]
MNQWQLLPQWKKDLFSSPASELNAWKAAKNTPVQGQPFEPVVFEVYMAAPIPRGMCSPCYKPNTTNPAALEGRIVSEQVAGSDPVRYEWQWTCPQLSGLNYEGEDFTPWSQRHVNYVVDCLQPWINAGIKNFWLDAAISNGFSIPDQRSYGRRRGTLELSYMPYFLQQGARFGGETFPDLASVNHWIDDCSVSYMPWFGLSTVATRYPDTSVSPPAWRRVFHPANQGWNLVRSTSEVLFAPVTTRTWKSGSGVPEFPPESNYPFTFKEIGEARKRGFVLSVYNCGAPDQFGNEYCEYVKRWYSMGEVIVADFDGSGTIELDENKPNSDLIQFLNAFDATKQAIAAGQNPLIVFATGDANGNGVFEDPADATVFQEAYYRYLNDFNDIVKRQLGIAKHK